MPHLYFADNQEPIGEISEEQLQELQQLLVEEDEQDRDYYISQDTLDMLADLGLEPGLLALLKRALADREEMDIGWSES